MAFDQTAKLSFVLQAKDLASKTFKEARGNLGALDTAAGKTGKSFGGLTKLGVTPMNVAFGAAALGATVLVGALVEGAKAAAKDEESQNRLRASLEANVKGFDGNTDAIEKTITKMQRLGFEDEQQRDALTVLVGATHDVAKAQKTLGIAMDLARFKGIDLRTASEALIKVEGGHYRALAQLGIKLRQGATAQEALTAVQKIATGQAEAYANTISGKLLAVQIKLDEAMEDFGRVTLPIVADALNAVTAALTPATTSQEIWADAAAHGSKIALIALKELEKDGVTALGKLDAKLHTSADAFQHIPDTMQVSLEATVKMVRLLPGDIAKALRDRRTAWQQAWDEYKQTLKDAMSSGTQIAKLEAILTSKRLAAGLRSNNPEVRAAAESMRDTALAGLTALKSDAGTLGRRGGGEFSEALRAQSDAAYKAGKKVGDAAADGLRKGWGNPNLKFQIGGTGGGGKGTGKLAAGGPGSGLTWVGEKGPELLDLPPGSYVHNNRESMRMAGSTTLIVNFNSAFPPTPQQARAVVPELVREMRRQHVLA